MCYDIVANTLQEIEYALIRGDIHHAEELQRRLEDWQIANNSKQYYHASGFEHPNLMVFTNLQPTKPQYFSWGLVPPWTRNREEALRLRKSNIAARSEAMFETPSYKESAVGKRCLIYSDGFYEFHDLNGKKYPFYISRKDKKPLIIAGLWSEWIGPETKKPFYSVAVVTTRANVLLRKIHNNPAKSEGPRMPVILTPENQNDWLKPIRSDQDKKDILQLCFPYNGELVAHPVGPIRGKDYVGNCQDVFKKINNSELQPLLKNL